MFTENTCLAVQTKQKPKKLHFFCFCFFYSLFSILVACLSFNSYENVAKVVHNVGMLLLTEL